MISLPLQPKVVEKKDNTAKFEIEALYPGYGVTIGNSLRRVILSSLPGAAVTQMKIKGVQHEFSTISGLMEDVITIMLNLKQLRFKLYGLEPQKGSLKVKGEKEVLGSDFNLPSQVELINKNCHIATLTDKKAELEMEIQIERGIGYVPRESRKQEKLEIGVIPIDAIFTPIRRVSMQLEHMRVGDRTDFDRLFLEIETDGTITPEDAFYQATETLVKHFSVLMENYKLEERETKEKTEEASEMSEEEASKIKVEDLKLSTRTVNALVKNNIKNVGGILKKKESDLFEMEGMGDKAVKEIKKFLKKLNLELRQ